MRKVTRTPFRCLRTDKETLFSKLVHLPLAIACGCGRSKVTRKNSHVQILFALFIFEIYEKFPLYGIK